MRSKPCALAVTAAGAVSPSDWTWMSLGSTSENSRRIRSQAMRDEITFDTAASRGCICCATAGGGGVTDCVFGGSGVAASWIFAALNVFCALETRAVWTRLPPPITIMAAKPVMAAARTAGCGAPRDTPPSLRRGGG